MSEQIIILWRLGYIKLSDMLDDNYVTISDKTGDHEYKRLIGRLYWRVY